MSTARLRQPRARRAVRLERFLNSTRIASRAQTYPSSGVFDPAEKRFARVLMLMARYGRNEGEAWLLPTVPQETLAEMVGTTRPRVNFFMNKFRKLGFIDYNGELIIRTALLSVVLLD